MSADTYRDRRESFKQLARDILDGKKEDGNNYVSRSWYDGKSFLLLFKFYFVMESVFLKGPVLT